MDRLSFLVQCSRVDYYLDKRLFQVDNLLAFDLVHGVQKSETWEGGR